MWLVTSLPRPRAGGEATRRETCRVELPEQTDHVAACCARLWFCSREATAAPEGSEPHRHRSRRISLVPCLSGGVMLLLEASCSAAVAVIPDFARHNNVLGTEGGRGTRGQVGQVGQRKGLRAGSRAPFAFISSINEAEDNVSIILAQVPLWSDGPVVRWPPPGVVHCVQ